jgi:hypothetical protein
MPIRCSVTMVTRARLIIAMLVAATSTAAVTVASAATTATTPPASGCVAPRLVGMTEQAAARTARAAGCIVHLAGAALERATVQTVAAQAPAPGARSIVIRLTLNPLCFGAALTGPPHNQGMRPGPTELITGLYLVGGPVLPYSSPHCRRPPGKPGTPAPGTIEVFGLSDGTLVASRTIKRGRLVTFKLAPGRYRVSDRALHGTQILVRPFTIRAGYTTIRYVIEPVP